MKSILVLVVLLLLFRPGPVLSDAPSSSNAARQLGNAFADAVERVMPAVVVVRTESTVMHAMRDMFLGGTWGFPSVLRAGVGSSSRARGTC